jgi:ABC-2 type transport system ATP-binding protein
VGAIVESPDLYRYLTGRENLEHFARMLPSGAKGRIEELGAMVALSDRLDDRVSTYSLGMRQRLGIAQALLGEPDILILDEPANGLDPAGIREIRQLVRRLAAGQGIGVFVSSHLLSEIEQTADRVAIIHRGRTLASGSVRELSARSGSDRVRVRARPAVRAAERLALFGAVEGASPSAGSGEDGVVTARIPPDRVPEAMRALLADGIEVFTVERPASTLEEVFLEITGGETV